MASEETLKHNDEATNQILKVLGDFRSEMNDSMGEFRKEVNESIDGLNGRIMVSAERLAVIEADIDEIKQSQFSFDVRLERIQAMAHDALNIGHDLKADVKILNAEVRAWAADVAGLQQQPA